MGLEGALDPDAGVGAADGLDGALVEDLGAVEGELGGLAVVELGDGEGFGDDAGVGGEDAGDIGPDDDVGGSERGADEGGREVAAAAAERGGVALCGAADEAGDDGDGAGVEVGREGSSDAACCDVGDGARLGEAGVGFEEGVGAEREGRAAGSFEREREELGGELFADGDNAVLGARARFTEGDDCLDKVGEFVAEEADAGARLTAGVVEGGEGFVVSERDGRDLCAGLIGAAVGGCGDGAEEGVCGSAHG